MGKRGTTPLIKNTFVGFFVSTPPFFFFFSSSMREAPAVAVINVNFLIRIPTITAGARCPRTTSRTTRGGGGKIGTMLTGANVERKKEGWNKRQRSAWKS